jgi:hypothetical protein
MWQLTFVAQRVGMIQSMLSQFETEASKHKGLAKSAKPEDLGGENNRATKHQPRRGDRY